jgi:serine/threonine protein kinase
MYNQKIIHRDLKPANILINKDIVKISDFGFSKMLMYSPEASILKTYAGSPLYMAPQILNQQ